TYSTFVDYLHKIEKETNRLKVVDIGKTSEGLPHVVAIVTSPENMKKLDHYRDISSQLAHAEGLTDDQARALAKEGKTVVLIDGGLHATEVLGAQQVIENVWQMVSRTDPETMRFLNDDIIIYVEANPDGMDLVSKWYMRHRDPMQRTTNGLPVLYQKYAGHDDNRDSYMCNLPEITNINQVMFQQWFPQIVYDNHQTGPAGTVMFAPPFRDPFNYNFDPQVPVEIELVAAAMHSRFVAEGKPGVTNRKGSTYSTWFNGGQRTVTYFHNMVGLLTETIGNPTPMEIPFIPSKQLPDSNLYFPIEPQVWHFRQSIDYSMTASRAVMDIASRERENLLYNFYRMGKNSIERGNRDSWTTTYHKVTAAESAVGAQGTPDQFKQMFRNPEQRDARGFIVPSDQPDFPTATKFINTLIKNGVTINRANAPFTVAGKSYPAGSWVVKSAQAFRPHVLDMFEPQDHPDKIPYPGGPPTPPYDAAGYTLAYQMGVKFDRILDGFDGPFEKVTGLQKPMPGKVTPGSGPMAFSHENTNSFIAANRLVAAGRDVEWLKDASGHQFVVTGASPDELQKIATDLGVTFSPLPSGTSTAGAVKLHKLRIGLVDQYGGSMPSGWTRYIFEQFEFPYDLVFPKALDAGNLISKYDVIVFPSGTFPAALAGGGGGRGGRGGGGGGRAGGAGRGGRGGNAAAAPETAPAGLAQRGAAPTPGAGGGGRGGGVPADLPAEYQDRVGAITAQTTVPQLRKFLEDGGTIVAVGQSAALARALGLPIENHLSERAADGSDVPLPREKFYVPGSVLRMAVDNNHPAAQGAADHVDVFFDNDQVFDLGPDAALKGVRPIAWFDSSAPLRSGWAWGQGYLNGGVAGLEATIGKGHLIAWTPEITFRAQPHGTFKFLFNGIYLAAQGK
ncbi:MAG TPA: M14 metallopeptidase family protein, partial [Vicinamibacterales bacterium]|nr:M14 metallopeptidase family protein [Vicinamibacterales bacterium]